MSSPRDPGQDLSLERLGDRAGRRPAPLGQVAQVAAPVAGASRAAEQPGAYQALNDAVFTAPGAAEWLRGLQRKVAALLAAESPAPRDPVTSDAIQAGDPFAVRA